MPLIPVILSGGAGSRLWPVSRQLHPKPFIRMPDGETLLQKAFVRAQNLPNVSDIVTVTNEELFFKTVDEFSEIKQKNIINTLLLEPVGKNTAAAITLAAFYLSERYSQDALLLVLAADHLITDGAAFAEAVAQAEILAQQNKLVLFGVSPDAPETGYGYIEAAGNNVVRFIEKPTREKAQEYFTSKQFLWNAGIFCFSASTLLTAMQRYCPEVFLAAKRCLQDISMTTENANYLQLRFPMTSFQEMPDISIDYAVMEKAENVAVVPCQIGWSDIGSWKAIGELATKDHQNNRIEADTVLHDVSDCYIRGGERMIGVVGVSNLIVIDTPDALLVAGEHCSQEVKQLYAKLKEKQHQTYKLHRTVHRPWGTYTVLEEGDGFKIKRIEVKSGASLSLQMHHHRSEHWIVVAGQARVINGEQELIINKNESTYIPAGHKHRLENITDTNLVLIEVQSGSYLGEDDIVRFDDRYGRASGG